MSITTEINNNDNHLTIKISGRFDYNLQQDFKKAYTQQKSIHKDADLHSNSTTNPTFNPTSNPTSNPISNSTPTLNPKTDEPLSNYTIDLTKVNYLDSSALGMLLSLRSFSNHYACINIIGANQAIQELLELSGFDKLFNLNQFIPE